MFTYINYKQMDIAKGLIILVLILGIILLTVFFVSKGEISKKCDPTIVYKYLPRTLEEEQTEPIYVTQIFKTMFTQPSIWIDSTYQDTIRRTEQINKYFITQL
jgi:hypothetical protein